MTRTEQDARFFDAAPRGAARPLALRAETGDDLPVMAALVQDAVLAVSELSYDRRGRKLALLLNRFRWEDADAAEAEGRPYERVRTLLVVSDVMAVKSAGVDRRESDLVLSLLTLTWQAGDDGTGRLVFEFAGDGQIAVDVETLNLDLRDVTKPYLAPSRHRPGHDLS